MTVVGDVNSRLMVADACATQRPRTFWMHLSMRAQKLPDGCSASRVPVQVGDDLMKSIQALVVYARFTLLVGCVGVRSHPPSSVVPSSVALLAAMATKASPKELMSWGPSRGPKGARPPGP